jgi:hypothetical protein
MHALCTHAYPCSTYMQMCTNQCFRRVRACTMLSCIPLQCLYAIVHAYVFEACVGMPYALMHTLTLAAPTCQCTCVSAMFNLKHAVHCSWSEKVDGPASQNSVHLHHERYSAYGWTPMHQRSSTLEASRMLCAIWFSLFQLHGGHALSLEPRMRNNTMAAHNLQDYLYVLHTVSCACVTKV